MRAYNHIILNLLVSEKDCASWSSEKLGEIYDNHWDISSRVMRVTVVTLTIGDAQFFGLDYEVWKTHHLFLYSP